MADDAAELEEFPTMYVMAAEIEEWKEKLQAAGVPAMYAAAVVIAARKVRQKETSAMMAEIEAQEREDES